MEMILQKKRHQHSKDMSDLIAKLKFLEGEHALLENKIVRLNKEVEAKQGYKT